MYSDTFSVIISMIGVMSCGGIWFIYLKHKENRLIKGTSWALSILSLIGIVTALATDCMLKLAYFF